VRRPLCPLLSGGPCPRHAPSKPTALERQLRPEAYERRRGGYLDRRQPAVGARSWSPVADRVKSSFFWVVTITRPEGARDRAWSEGGADALANRDPTASPIDRRTVHPQPTAERLNLRGTMAKLTARGPPTSAEACGTHFEKPLEPRRPRCDDRER
jgi:hypothetical protein